jgi:hypothetical protein
MEFVMSDFDSAFIVNIDACLKDESVPAVVKILYQKLKDVQYVHVGDYFKSINSKDLQTLVDYSEICHQHSLDPEDTEDQEVSDAYHAMILLSMGLLLGEGSIVDETQTEHAMKATIMFIALEALYRKGLIQVFHDKWSLSYNENDIIAKPIEE